HGSDDIKDALAVLPGAAAYVGRLQAIGKTSAPCGQVGAEARQFVVVPECGTDGQFRLYGKRRSTGAKPSGISLYAHAMCDPRAKEPSQTAATTTLHTRSS